MKIIFVEFRGLKDHNPVEFCLTFIPPELTVSEFKSHLGEDSELVVYAPIRTLPLLDTALLYDHVRDWDTVTVASCWINAPAVRETSRL
jgi:hypothetical protein